MRNYLAGVVLGVALFAGPFMALGYHLGGGDARADQVAVAACPTVERVAVVKLEGCINLIDSGAKPRAQGPWVFRVPLTKSPPRAEVLALETP